jgi:hypothetical protein
MANLNGLKKYHFIYKTTNLVNGKYYVGMHSTNKLNDGYLGSGKRLRLSIKKYGIENFKIEYLEFFDSRELLVEREKQLVNEELLKDTNCMNLKTGGTGGFFGKSASIGRLLGNKKHNILLKTDINYRNSYSSKISNTFKQKHKNGIYKNAVSKLKKYWVGKSHTEETKQKISEIKKGTGVGKTNSQFGTMWITNGTENKKIKKEERIPTGWKAGRMLNIL